MRPRFGTSSYIRITLILAAFAAPLEDLHTLSLPLAARQFVLSGWTRRPALAHCSRMGNATKPKKPRKPTRTGAKKTAVRRLRVDPKKPIMGQGAGTVTFSPDFDPEEPAYPLSDWKHLNG